MCSCGIFNEWSCFREYDCYPCDDVDAGVYHWLAAALTPPTELKNASPVAHSNRWGPVTVPRREGCRRW